MRRSSSSHAYLSTPFTALVATSLLLSSCSKDAHEKVPRAGTITANNPKAEALFAQATQQEASGKLGKAAKTYFEVYKNYPFSTQAAESLYRRAVIQENDGELFDAFESYQTFLNRYPANSKYSTALAKQAKVAHAAADGHITNNFIGLKTRIDPVRTEKMLKKVISNAPRSASAPKAQFAIGQLWQERGDVKKAMAAYEEVVTGYSTSTQAPEAQYRIGVLLIKQAERGNQDQANLQSARQAFQDLLNLYPNSKRAPEARTRLASLNSQEIAGSLKIGEFYEKKGELESAKFYYREVISKVKSGPIHDRAKARLAAIGG